MAMKQQTKTVVSTRAEETEHAGFHEATTFYDIFLLSLCLKVSLKAVVVSFQQ